MRDFLRLIALSLPVLLGLLGCPGRARAQAAPDEATVTGQLLDQTTRRPLGFVSVGVLRQPFGTVADAQGRFRLRLPASYDADSVRLSLLGYASRTLAVAALRRDAARGPLLLQPQAVPLQAARVRASGLQRLVVGNSGGSALNGFRYNLAGNQLGQRMTVKRPAFLQEVSFRITHCTYDTVVLRLNVYELRDGFPGANILPRPVYLHLAREQTAGRIYVDLRPYKLWLTTDVAVCLELVDALATGTLVFQATWPGGGPCYELRQTPGPLAGRNIAPKGTVDVKVREEPQPDHGPWTRMPGVGLSIEAVLLQLPPG